MVKPAQLRAVPGQHVPYKPVAVPGQAARHGVMPGQAAEHVSDKYGAVLGQAAQHVSDLSDRHGAVPGQAAQHVADRHGAVPGQAAQHVADVADRHGAVPGQAAQPSAVPGQHVSDEHGAVQGQAAQHGPLSVQAAQEQAVPGADKDPSEDKYRTGIHSDSVEVEYGDVGTVDVTSDSQRGWIVTIPVRGMEGGQEEQ